MKKMLLRFSTLAFAGMLLLACKENGIGTGEFGGMVEQGAIIAGEDPETASRYRDAASGVTGVFAQMTPETERELGGGIALQAFNEIGPLYENDEMQRYVNLVGRTITRQGSRPDLAYSFAVIDNETPNAFAAPGGYIFITTGALKLMNSESELAGVLAHEIAHVTEKHMLQTYRRSQVFSAAQQTAALFDDNVVEYSKMVDFGTDVLFHRGLDQRFEFEADLVGVELAALTGYDAQGLNTFLRNLETSTGKSGGWLRTHPSSGERMKRIEAILPQLQNAQGIRNDERFQRYVKQNLRGTAAQTASLSQ